MITVYIDHALGIIFYYLNLLIKGITRSTIMEVPKLILVILAIFTSQKVNAFHNLSNCSEEFKSILEKAAEVKHQCNIKGFYDCCEVGRPLVQ